MAVLARVYRAVFGAEFAAAAQYRVQSVLWLLFAIIRPVVFLAAWSAVAEAQGGSVGAFTTADFAAYYVAVSLVSQLTMSWSAYDFEYEIRQGLLAPKLLRPLHPLHYSVVQNIVWKAVTLPALLPALALIAWTFHATFVTQPWQVALFVPSVLLAAALNFLLGWALACAAFWTTRIHSIMRFYERVGFLFAGQVAPLTLLPGALATLGYILPFGYMLWAPVEILRGAASLEQALALIGIQAVWVVIAWVSYATAWRFGLRQFSAVGA
jgi:ABC-2 type transport system permease protein